ncbi:hypothetical protein D3C80_1810150 [compost metagenome]
MRLDHTKDSRSSLRSYNSSVAIGITMLTARVIRKTPRMNAMKCNAGRGIEQTHHVAVPGSINFTKKMSSKKVVKEKSVP